MRIRVTQEHIDAGKPSKICDCPIALAIKEKLKNVHKVIVSSKSFHIPISDDQILYKFSRRTRRFIKNFDNGRKVEPFSFNAPIPERYLCEST